MILLFIGFKLWVTLVALAIVALIISRQTFILIQLQKTSIVPLVRYFRQPTDYFSLTEVGQYQGIDLQKQQLSSSSQINLWGYWLIFIDKNQPSKFVFKDSLSLQDRARLARVILRQQQPMKKPTN